MSTVIVKRHGKEAALEILYTTQDGAYVVCENNITHEKLPYLVVHLRTGLRVPSGQATPESRWVVVSPAAATKKNSILFAEQFASLNAFDVETGKPLVAKENIPALMKWTREWTPGIALPVFE